LTTYSITQNKSLDTLFYRSALAYVQKIGWPVFPLKPLDKKPWFKGGFYNATKDINQIKEWWSSFPNANIGIPTGKASGFIALDIDTRHGGEESIQDIQDKYGEMPKTIEALTGSGGRHLLFNNPGPVNNKVNIKPGLDLRGEGGYIVVAPSIHPSGEQYEWEVSNHPIETEIADCPGWLLNIINNRDPEEKRSSNYWSRLLKGVEEGNRNNAATQLAGHLFRRYVDPSIVLELMYMWNETRVFPPLKQKELESIINSVAGKELARRKGENHG